MDIDYWEKELKRRWEYPYKWCRAQNNDWDYITNFVYTCPSFEKVLYFAFKTTKGRRDKFLLQHYALNRWYNFWSAKVVEDIFCSQPDVVPHTDEKNKLIDFTIQGITFDQKTSVFPKAYLGYLKRYSALQQAKSNTRDLVEWLYKHQSQEGRLHYKNRLFIVLYDIQNEEHWKLKAELYWLKDLIKKYVFNFNNSNLMEFDFEGHMVNTTLSDIIWGIK